MSLISYTLHAQDEGKKDRTRILKSVVCRQRCIIMVVSHIYSTFNLCQVQIRWRRKKEGKTGRKDVKSSVGRFNFYATEVEILSTIKC